MVDAIVSSIVEDVIGRLNSLLAQEFGLFWGFKRDLLDLQSKFSHIQAVLEDAEVKQKKSKAIQDWLRKLRAASLEMENLLDEISTEAMIQKVDREMGIKNQVRAFFSARNPISFRCRMAHRMKYIRERLELIAAEKSKFGLKEGVNEDIGVTIDLRSRLTDSHVNDLEIVGRDEEKEMIIKKICDENLVNHGDAISVYSIWGMGGIGKTTLCQLIYNHQTVTEHFPLKMWVCVSEDFDVLRLTKAILECVEKSSCDLTQLDIVQQRLQEKLHEKRFLLVLDDVWSEDRNKWEKLRQILVCGASGSVIMVTTRMEPIARMMSIHAEFIHRIGCLSEHESWYLFERLAFGIGRSEGNISDLEPIGRKIVEKCQGLPLAVKALGSLMWSKNSMEEWSSVLASDIWDLPQEEVSSVLPALKLSYDNLPRHYRQCFSYCCLFLKDYKMSKDLLIQLWMANGFIPTRRGADLYGVGEEIVKGLMWRSFFEDAGKDLEGRETCKMHDLMHDLAKSVMGDECWLMEPGKELRFPIEVLHMSSPWGYPTKQDFVKVRSLRSMIIFNAGVGTDTDSIFLDDSIFLELSDQRRLRALHLEGIMFQKLPKAICNLKLLRYLNLSGSDVQVLPESIIYLQNLQVLNLRGCGNLVKLPEGMRYMKKLQFLDIRDCHRLKSMPSGIGQLGGLRRLTNFVVGEDSGNGIKELGELNQLGWELEISRLERVRGAKDAKGAKLENKQNLIDLGLSWSGEDEDEKRQEEVVECLEPHPNLKRLEIKDYKGLQLPIWIINLVNLVEVKLNGCRNCEILLPKHGKLPVLKVLVIEAMGALKSFDDDSSISTSTSSSGEGEGVCFPCLQVLKISHCPRLIALPSNLPKLESLDISHCPRLIALPSNLPKIEILKIFDCDELASLPDEMGMGRSYSQLLSLVIWSCPKLKRLPDGMQNLRALKYLDITKCKHLTRTCKKGIGEDWPKIAHVTHIDIVDDIGCTIL